jgi:serine/threonine protein kinase
VLYVVLELVRGQSLAQRLRASGPCSFEEATKWLLDMFDALEHAHRRGVLHRDLKPANVMIDDRGRARVMDFGLARHLPTERAQSIETDATQTVPGMMVGTPGYMAPEQIRGETVDVRADQYALGLIAFLLLSGQRTIETVTARPTGTPRPESATRAPIGGADTLKAAPDEKTNGVTDARAVLFRHLSPEPWPQLGDVVDHIPRAVEAVVARMVEKDRSKRYPDTAQAHEAFVQALVKVSTSLD